MSKKRKGNFTPKGQDRKPRQPAVPAESELIKQSTPPETPVISKGKIKIPSWAKTTFGWIVAAAIGWVFNDGIRELRSGPKISILAKHFLTVIPPGPPGPVDYLAYVFPATIYNKGDKPYFISDQKIELLLDNGWTELVKTSLGEYPIYDWGDNAFNELDPRLNLDSVYTIQPYSSITGRFVFRPAPNTRIYLSPTRSYSYRITLIDENGKAYSQTDKLPPETSLKPGASYPRDGLKSVDFPDIDSAH